MKNSLRALIGASVLAVGMLGAANADSGAQSETASAYYKAAVQGSADAQASLAAMYASGTGVAQSDTMAFQWYMRAAEQGHPLAQLQLGARWADGAGVRKSNPLAYKWAYLAKTRAVDAPTRRKAEELLALLAREMPQVEIAEARQNAAEWKPQLEITQPTQVQPAQTAQPAGIQPVQATHPPRVQPVRTTQPTRVQAVRTTQPTRVQPVRRVASPGPHEKSSRTAPDEKNIRAWARAQAAHSVESTEPRRRSIRRDFRARLTSLARRLGL